MKRKVVLAGLVTVVMLSLTAFQGAANTLYEDSRFVEGVGLDGLDVYPGTITHDDLTTTTITTGAAKNVMVGWSDDIIYHQFPVGQKVRTEVLLHVVEVNADGEMLVDPVTGAATPVCAVYTITAHFKIEVMSAPPLTSGYVLYESSIAEGLWVDGPSDAYSAEVNLPGDLLYGYNWDTRGLFAGWYRLSFWIEVDASCPTVNPATGTPISYPGVDICFGDPTDVDSESGKIFGFVTVLPDKELSYLDLFLTQKTTGRGQSGK